MAQYNNPYYVEPANLSLGFDKALAGIQQGIETRKATKQTAEDKQAMSDFAENFENMTPVEVGQYVLKNPRVAKFIVGAAETTNKMTKQEKLDDAIEVATAFLTGGQEQPGQVPDLKVQPPAQPGQTPVAMQPAIGLEPSPVAPVMGAAVGQEQTPLPAEAQAPTGKNKAIKVLSAHVQENLTRGGNSAEGIELIRDTMTGGEKAFKGSMATIAALDPQTFDRLMELSGGDVSTGTTTDISRYSDLMEKQYAIDNPGKTMPPGEKAIAMQDFKRANSAEAQAVMLAKLEAKLQLEPQIASEVTKAEKEVLRGQGVITKGLDAAEAMPILKRTIGLLERVKTGGWRSIDLAVRQKLGIEGSDEGELNNSLGKAVLTQLRATFGAAFTFGEGQSLKDLEAGFSKSNATNMRLIKRLIRQSDVAIKQARQRAEDNGDTATIREIDEFMKFSLAPDEGQPQMPTVNTQEQYDALESGDSYLGANGQSYRKP